MLHLPSSNGGSVTGPFCSTVHIFTVESIIIRILCRGESMHLMIFACSLMAVRVYVLFLNRVTQLEREFLKYRVQ
jgi:hypothetical protein